MADLNYETTEKKGQPYVGLCLCWKKSNVLKETVVTTKHLSFILVFLSGFVKIIKNFFMIND